MLPAHGRNCAEWIDGAGAHRSRCADDHERQIAGGCVRRHGSSQDVDVHAEISAGWNPADRFRSQAREVGGLLNPGMGLGRPIHPQATRRGVAHALLTNVPAGLGGTRGPEADEVCHVAAADHEPAARHWVANQLGDPAHGLRFDLRGRRRQRPGADVGVERRRQKVAQDADRRRRRSDVPEEARVSVEQRVIEQLRCRPFQQRARIGATLRQRAVEIESRSDSGRGFIPGHRAVRNRVQKGGELLHEPVTERSECRARPSRLATAGPAGQTPPLFLPRCPTTPCRAPSSWANTFEEIRLLRPAAVHRAEHAIEGL